MSLATCASLLSRSQTCRACTGRIGVARLPVGQELARIAASLLPPFRPPSAEPLFALKNLLVLCAEEPPGIGKIGSMRGVLPLLLCTFATAFVPHAPPPLDLAKQGRAVAPPGSGSCGLPGRFCVRAPGVALRGKGFGGLSNPVRSKDPDEKREERARREKERLAAKEEKVSGEAFLGLFLH